MHINLDFISSHDGETRPYTKSIQDTILPTARRFPGYTIIIWERVEGKAITNYDSKENRIEGMATSVDGRRYFA